MIDVLLFAATTQQRIGVFVAAFMVVGWLVYLVVNLRRRDEPALAPGSEIELAPNRKPYYNDEAMEGPRLERALGWALLLLIVCSAGPIVYWVREPGRQAGAERGFESRAIGRGRSLFQPTDSPEHGAHFGCATCHGSVGQGGATQFTITEADGSTRTVTWAAPRLDTAAHKFSPEEIRTILVYGRANTPMPAWGVEGGGPMNDQQIDDLVAYIESIKVPNEKARALALEAAETEARSSGKSAADGETLFRANCARCHTKGWSFGEPEEMGGGAFGPNLTNGTVVRQFPVEDALIEFLGAGSEFGKPYGVRGVGGSEGGGMPGFARELSPAQIRAIARYIRGL